MCRVRGFEEVARDLGHIAQFITLTLPSRFHAQLADAKANPNYAKLSVRAGQEWLCKMWSRARAALKRRKVVMYGFRVAEPHHDGTPHWHMLIFSAQRDATIVCNVLSHYWLSDDGSEPGAAEHRVKIEAIDPSKGSAAGYIAKYVSKNIDAAGQIATATDHETGVNVSDSVLRVEAWAAIHGIRQFQQIGGPPVGLWREMRRLRDAVEDNDIERARRAADDGDWRAFVYAVSPDHVRCGRRTSLKLLKAETGECGRYGELRPPRVVGVSYASAFELTRLHTWRITPKGQPSRCESSSKETTGHRCGADGTSRTNAPLSASEQPGPGSTPVRCAEIEADDVDMRDLQSVGRDFFRAPPARLMTWTRVHNCTPSHVHDSS
jgi:hypothetical protein